MKSRPTFPAFTFPRQTFVHPFSMIAVASLALMSCKSRDFNVSDSKTSPTKPQNQAQNLTSEAQLVEDLPSRAFIPQTKKMAGDIPLKGDLHNICLEAVPKLAFNGKLEKPNLQTLAFFSLLSHISYEDLDTASEVGKLLGFKETVQIEDKTTSSTALLFVHEDYLILSLAGTNDPYDLITDLDLVTTKTLFGFGIHKGFLRAYMGNYASDATKPPKVKHEGIRRGLLDTIQKYGYPNKKIFVTGHSLGAGLSTLFSMNLAIRELTKDGAELPDSCGSLSGPINNVAGVINFASSRVGGHKFAECYQKLLGDKTWRVVNHRDFLPYMPDRRFYKHVGQRVALDADANINYTPDTAEETVNGFFEFLSVLAQGGLGGSVTDHINYYIKMAHALEPKCSEKRIWKKPKP